MKSIAGFRQLYNAQNGTLWAFFICVKRHTVFARKQRRRGSTIVLYIQKFQMLHSIVNTASPEKVKFSRSRGVELGQRREWRVGCIVVYLPPMISLGNAAVVNMSAADMGIRERRRMAVRFSW